MRNTRKDSAFISNTWHSNVAMSIGGRLLAMGYGGWVWTHGLDLEGRTILIHNLMSDIENVSEFDKYNIQYAIQRGDDKGLGFNFPELNESSNWILLFNSPYTKLYRITHT